MRIFNLFVKNDKMAKNSLGQPLDRLTSEGELPFGWMAHRKDIVNQIEAEVSSYRKAIHEAKGTKQEAPAIESYFRYLDEGKRRYYQIGECEGKYFEEYVIDSEETAGNARKLVRLKSKK